MGRERRRGSRRRERQQRAAEGQPAAPERGPGPGRRPSRPRWRRTLDSWGGIPVVGSIAGALVIVGALVVFNLPGDEVNDDAPFVPYAREQVDGKRWGDAGAPVEIIEFADFQCPFCARFAQETERQLAEEFIAPGTVRLRFHHYAFLGQESLRAAEASECAAEQGRFWDYHDLLFLRQGRENSGAFSSERLVDFARELNTAVAGFDVDAFASCLDSGRMRDVVIQETNQTEQAGITQTPSFLINGKLLTGAQDIAVFREAIRQALDEAETGSSGDDADTGDDTGAEG